MGITGGIWGCGDMGEGGRRLRSGLAVLIQGGGGFRWVSGGDGCWHMYMKTGPLAPPTIFVRHADPSAVAPAMRSDARRDLLGGSMEGGVCVQ